jgi:hypothetical protein
MDFDFTVNADKIEKLVISFTNPRLEKLPEVINTFFRAKNAFDSEALAGCFTENAVLYDEERELRGRNVVCSHIMEANSKAKVKTEVDHAIALKGETIVVATLHGDFPGSPAALDFHFTLEGQKIGALNITLLREQQ